MSRGLVAAIVALIALAGACEQPPESAGTAEIPAGPDTLPPPDQVVEDGEHVMTVDGVKKAVLVAEQLYFYNDISTVVGDTVQVSFFGEGGEFVSMLTARSSVINQRSQEMTARGEVDVRSEDSRIQTEVLHFEPEANRIWSDHPTTINQQGNLIRGQGVESDPGLKDIRIRGGSAVLRSEPDLGPRPRADTTAQSPGRGTEPAPRERRPETEERQPQTEETRPETGEPPETGAQPETGEPRPETGEGGEQADGDA